MKVRLISDFHKTETFVIAKKEGVKYYISERAYKRAKRKLCGIKGCQCGAPHGLFYTPGYYPGEGYAEVDGIIAL